MKIVTQRIYDSPSKGAGCRVLVDRLWPRGLKKEQVAVDLWLKDLAPSNELRKWFGHEPSRWAEFKRRYLKELEGRGEAVEKLRATCRGKSTLTLLYGAKDTEHNQAVALKEFLGR